MSSRHALLDAAKDFLHPCPAHALKLVATHEPRTGLVVVCVATPDPETCRRVYLDLSQYPLPRVADAEPNTAHPRA